MRRRACQIIALLAVAAACSSGPAAPSATPTFGISNESGTSVVHVVVDSGPLAGTYDSRGVKSDCNISSEGSGASYGDPTKAEGVTAFVFSSVGGEPSSPFFFQAHFGAIVFGQPNVLVNTLDPQGRAGTGAASMADNGVSIKWSIEGTTAEGFVVHATIECGPVDRG